MASTMSNVTLNIKVGHEIQSLKMSHDEWRAVQSGEPLVRDSAGFYEGEEFKYTWRFNDPRCPTTSLVVLYDDAEGFSGSIEDGWLS